MCTVSWIHVPGGYHLLCNRDEKNDRPPAIGPRIGERASVRFIAPVDPQSGGSWIGVNEFGVSVCLLNGKNASDPALAVRSRGLIVRDLIWAELASECMLWLKQLNLTRIAPFTVLSLQPEMPATIGEWDGENLKLVESADSYMPLTSSSYDPARAREIRCNEYRTITRSMGRIDASLLRAFHRSHGRAASPYSVCMHRADAQTVSFSHIFVTPAEIRFSYSPSAPCTFAPPEEQALRRAAWTALGSRLSATSTPHARGSVRFDSLSGDCAGGANADFRCSFRKVDP
jgi:hypothetical protein